MRFNYLFCALILFGCTKPAKTTSDVQQEPQPVITAIVLDLSKIPDKCERYLHLLEDSENPSRFMAQIEQESGCNPFALSRTGAMGLVQIMPETLKWGARTFARHLGRPDANNPRYAVEFLKAYMAYFTVDLFDDYCSNKKVDELRYNGGFYVIWEIRQSDGTIEGGEALCGTQRLENGKMRSLSNCDENYGYWKHITRRQPKYLAMGGKLCK